MPDVGPAAGPGSTPAVMYDFTQSRARIEARREAAADRTGFTEEARELARARQSVEEAPDVRQEKVLSLKKQIEAGQYHPDPREVAQKILEGGL